MRILAPADSASSASPGEPSARELLLRRCKRIHVRLSKTETALDSLSREDICKHKEQALDVKREVAEISNVSLSLTVHESDTLPSMIVDLERRLFDCSLRLRELAFPMLHALHPLDQMPRESDCRNWTSPCLMETF